MVEVCMQKPILFGLIWAGLALFMVRGSAGDSLIERYVSEALENNPEIRTMQEKLFSAKSYVPQAGALANPTLGFRLMNIPATRWSFIQEPMTTKQMSFSQMFPYPGKRRLMTEMAERGVDTIEFQYEDRKIDVARRVKTAYYSLFFFRKAKEVIRRNISLLMNLVNVTETRYRVGKGLQQDIFKARVELSTLEGNLLSFQMKETTAEAMLNTLMNRLPTAVVETPDSIVMSAVYPSIENLLILSESQNLRLKSQEAQIDKLQTAYRLARKDRLPNFSVGVTFAQRDERRDFVSVTGGIIIPLYHKRKEDQKIEETLHFIRTDEARYEMMRNNIFNRITVLSAQLEEQKGLFEIYRDKSIPDAKGAYESSLSAYRVDRVDFLTVLTNLMALFRYEIDFYSALTWYEKTLAELAYEVGTIRL